MKLNNNIKALGILALIATGSQNAGAFAVNNGNVNQPGSASEAANQIVVDKVMFNNTTGTGINIIPQLRYQTSKLTDSSVPGITVHTKSIGVSVSVSYDIDDSSVGIIIPVDSIKRNFTESVPLAFRASTTSTVSDMRYGIVAFAKHKFGLSDGFSLSPSVVISSLFEQKGNAWAPGTGQVTKRHVTTNGYAVNIALGYVQNSLEADVAIGYQYNKDNSGTVSTIDFVTPWDRQKLFRVGFKGAIQASPALKIGTSAVWNKDSASFLKDNKMSTSYTNIGADLIYTASEQFALTVGYSALVGYTRASSSSVQLGGNWEF